MGEYIRTNKKKVLGIVALVILFFGVYSYGMHRGEKSVVDETAVTAESAATSNEGKADVEPSPEQIAESEAADEEDEYEGDPNRTMTQKYFPLMREVFVKNEDRFGLILEMHAVEDAKITVRTDKANYVIELSEYDGNAYITNMDTAERLKYKLD